MTAPILTIQSVTRNRISKLSGVNRAIVTFTTNQALTDWEARADGQGVGQGDLVGKAENLRQTWQQVNALGLTYAQLNDENRTWSDINTVLGETNTGTFEVDHDELTWGDRPYRINVYGENKNDEWSSFQP